MSITTNQLGLIGDIYDAAIDPDRWKATLDRLAKDIDAVGSIVVAVETVVESRFTVNRSSSLYDAETIKTYYENYGHYELPAWEVIKQAKAGFIITYADMWQDVEDYRHRPDGQWTERVWGYRERCAVKLNNEKAWTDAITFQFGVNRGDITQEERTHIGHFIPHIARTMFMSRAFSLLKTRFKAVLSALDRYRIGQCLVLPTGAIVLSNKTAQEVLGSNDGIGISTDNRIVVNDPGLQVKFASFLVRVCDTARSEGDSKGKTLTIRKKSGGDPYAVEISPLRDTDYEIDKQFKGALVSIIDPDRHPVVLDPIDRLYGLTTAEMNVLRLVVKGHSTEEIADSRSVSPGTVRQQIKSILAKMDCHNRTDLVRRALTVNLPIDRGE